MIVSTRKLIVRSGGTHWVDLDPATPQARAVLSGQIIERWFVVVAAPDMRKLNTPVGGTWRELPGLL